MDRFDQRLADLEAHRRAKGWKPEIERIIEIPRASNSEAQGISLVKEWSDKWRTSDGDCDLRPIQALALSSLAAQDAPRGLFGAIGVGHGKTLITLLAAKAVGAKRPLLLMPPDMEPQFRRDVEFWKQHFDIQVPEVLPYSKLSKADSTDILTELAPDLIIADECQALRRKTSARTKRVIRYAKANPQTRWVMLSGTTTAKSLNDYSHLMELALRDRSPLPLTHYDLTLWGSVIDVLGDPDRHAVDSMMPLIRSEGIEPTVFELADVDACRRLARRALFLRQSSTPGVVSTETMSLNADLELISYNIPPIAEITKALNNLHSSWCRPDGEEIADITQFHSIARQLSVGFYYKWDWPNGEKDFDWLEARAEWQRQIRIALRYASGVGHDSPLLVANKCKRAAEGRDYVPKERLAAWKAWQKVKDREPPPRKAIWLTKQVLEDVKGWCDQRARGLIWFHNEAVGEALSDMGFEVFGSGSDVPPNDVKFPALSIPVHSKGKNLQAWHEQLILQLPPGGQTMEQLLGRTHRQGQTSKIVRAYYLGHTQTFRRCLETAIKDAHYIESTQGTPQKLLNCRFRKVLPIVKVPCK